MANKKVSIGCNLGSSYSGYTDYTGENGAEMVNSSGNDIFASNQIISLWFQASSSSSATFPLTITVEDIVLFVK